MILPWVLALGTMTAHGAAAPAPTSWVNTDTKAFISLPETNAFISLPEASGVAAAQPIPIPAGEPTHIVVSLKPRLEGQLKQLAQDVNHPGNAKYGKFLTPKQFIAEYAPSEAQVQAVVAYLEKNGFINIRVAPNRLLISADGTAGTVRSAFNTPLVRYQIGGRVGYANPVPAQVPQELASIVGSVLGLQTVTRSHPMLRMGEPTKPATLANGIAKAHSPTEFPAIYNVGNLGNAASTTVGIITIGGVSQTLQDLQQFTGANGLSSINVLTVQTGASGADYSDDPDGQAEWDLDSQSIVGAAGGAVKQLIFYMADLDASGNTGLTQAINRAVSDNVAKVINVSLGWCEADAYADGTLQAEETIFAVAAAQGQTFSVASGDEGVYECNNRGFPDGASYSVSWPASSPNVIAVGGTTLYTTADNGYSIETVWNEGLDDTGKLWATGGGISAYLPSPSWQSKVMGGQAQRILPDIAFDAAQAPVR
jgi:pseudomonalisin